MKEWVVAAGIRSSLKLSLSVSVPPTEIPNRNK